ncbi:MAG: glycoside hydrolase family 1 protein [Anaerolineales bacterium]
MADAYFRFPDEFLWGTATAAHHVEGELTNSWSAWEDAGGHVYQNQKHGRACEWRFGRWREDFQRMSDLHTNTHRLSVEWSRIQPARDTWDEDALGQYREMIDDLHARGIVPMVSLHHFTNPLWIEDAGGWLNPDTVTHFARFTEKVLSALDDVTLWCTFNEPMVYAVQAYLVGFFNPGMKNPWAMYRCAEHMLRAHAAAYQIIKVANPAAQVGVAKHIVDFDAAPPDLVNRSLVYLPNRVFNRAFVDALVSGELAFPLRRKVVIHDLIGTSDYIGLNFYQRYRLAFTPLSPPFIQQIPDPASPEPPPLWGEIYPQGIFHIIRKIYTQTLLPIYVTESGTPDSGDTVRRWYIARLVAALWRAVMFNYPVRGLYYWSLVDSFEWTAGYNPQFRFGLYGMDFDTQARTKRPSGDFYGEICAAQGLTRDMIQRYVPDLLDELFPGAPGADKVQLR